MAFIVEDGTGKVDATSYIDVAYADSYFTDRNVSSWAGTTAEKQAALIKATDYIETRWAGRFLGYREFSDVQALSFPRLLLKNKEGKQILGIPDNLKKAVAEYAVRALTIDLMPDPVMTENGYSIKSKMEKVGPLEEKTEYETGSSAPVLIRPYPIADKLISEYTSLSGANYR